MIPLKVGGGHGFEKKGPCATVVGQLQRWLLQRAAFLLVLTSKHVQCLDTQTAAWAIWPVSNVRMYMQTDTHPIKIAVEDKIRKKFNMMSWHGIQAWCTSIIYTISYPYFDHRHVTSRSMHLATVLGWPSYLALLVTRQHQAFFAWLQAAWKLSRAWVESHDHGAIHHLWSLFAMENGGTWWNKEEFIVHLYYVFDDIKWYFLIDRTRCCLVWSIV